MFYTSFNWSLSDSKSPRVSRIHLSILAYLNNPTIWTFLILPVISSSSRSLGIIPMAPTMIGITITFMFHRWFKSILAYLNNPTIWMFLILPVISSSSRSLGIIPMAPTMIGITITFMFHRWFNSLARSKYLSNILLSFIFTL